jgi:hypothetical protein
VLVPSGSAMMTLAPLVRAASVSAMRSGVQTSHHPFLSSRLGEVVAPGGCFVVGESVSQAAVEDADEAVGELA